MDTKRWLRHAPDAPGRPGLINLADTPLGKSANEIAGFTSEVKRAMMNTLDFASTRPVRLSGLHSTGSQAVVERSQVEHYSGGGAADDHLFAVSPGAPLIVRDTNSQHFITDGTHRILGAMDRGETELAMKVYDINRGRFL